jgi:hypothetical protein
MVDIFAIVHVSARAAEGSAMRIRGSRRLGPVPALSVRATRPRPAPRARRSPARGCSAAPARRSALARAPRPGSGAPRRSSAMRASLCMCAPGSVKGCPGYRTVANAMAETSAVTDAIAAPRHPPGRQRTVPIAAHCQGGACSRLSRKRTLRLGPSSAQVAGAVQCVGTALRGTAPRPAARPIICVFTDIMVTIP